MTSNDLIRAQGRVLSLPEFLELQKLIDEHPNWSRHRDLDRRWPVPGLIAALRLLSGTRTALLRHFEECGTDTVSLRTLMNWAMPEPASPDGQSGLTPLLKIRFTVLPRKDSGQS